MHLFFTGQQFPTDTANITTVPYMCISVGAGEKGDENSVKHANLPINNMCNNYSIYILVSIQMFTIKQKILFVFAR